MCFSISASSSDRFIWIYSSDTYGLYFDSATAYYFKPGIIDFAIKQVYSDEEKKNLGYRYSLIHYQIDIKNREMQHIGSVAYNDADEAVRIVGGHGGFQPVLPSSSLIFDYVQKSMSDKSFHQITYEDMFLAGITVMQSNLGDVKSQMGNPESIEPLMIEGSYNYGALICKYPGMTYFIDSQNENKVIHISTTDTLMTTKRGIRVGDDITKLVSAYGSPDFKSQYYYKYNGPSTDYRNNLIFVLDAQSTKVAGIIISVMP